MATHDLQGRKYKLKTEAKAGDIIFVDDGFPCMARWSVRKIEKAEDGLWIRCKSGRHYLNGQEDYRDGTDALIGIYPLITSHNNQNL